MTGNDGPLLHALAVDWNTKRAQCNCPFGWGARWKNFVPDGVERGKVLNLVNKAHANHIREDDPILMEWRESNPFASWDQFGIDMGFGDEEEDTGSVDLPSEAE